MDWKDYWVTAPERSRSTDLYWQIGKTVADQPIGNEQVALMVGQIRKCLAIQPSDVWDFCCGNALITHKIAAYWTQSVGPGLLGTHGRSGAETPVPRQRRLPYRVSPRRFSSSSALWRTLHQDLPTRCAAVRPRCSGVTTALAEPGTSDGWAYFGAVPCRDNLCVFLQYTRPQTGLFPANEGRQ